MQEFLPVQALRAGFKAEIRKLRLAGKHERTALYAADTSFGDMTLLVETLTHAALPDLHTLSARNALIAKQQLAAPLVYEQEVVKVREDYVFCLTLTEPLALCDPQQPPYPPESAFEGLVRCAYRAAKAGFTYERECLRLGQVLRAQQNGGLFMDFTRMQVSTGDKEGGLAQFREALCEVMRRARGQRMQEVVFICESPFRFDLARIAGCHSWFELAMLFNLLHLEKATVVSETRTKILPVSKLSGPTRLREEGVDYPAFSFREGWRLDGAVELTLQQLKAEFFVEGSVYHMTKEKYVRVRRLPGRQLCSHSAASTGRASSTPRT